MPYTRMSTACRPAQIGVPIMAIASVVLTVMLVLNTHNARGKAYYAVDAPPVSPETTLLVTDVQDSTGQTGRPHFCALPEQGLFCGHWWAVTCTACPACALVHLPATWCGLCAFHAALSCSILVVSP